MGQWENKLLNEFKKKATKKNQAKKLRDDDGPDQGDEGRGAADFDAILEEAKSGSKARDQDFTTLAVPSDIAVNQVLASKNPLCRE